MRSFLPLLCGIVCLASCTSQTEYMAKGGSEGRDVYFYHLGQIGGKVVAKNSMGTSVSADNEKSLADVLQAAVAVKGFDMQTKIALAEEVTARYKAGQITIQMRDKLTAAIMGAETEAGLKVALAKIASGQ